MKKYLYDDLYLEEDAHWWHVGKRTCVINLIKNYKKRNWGTILDVGCGTGKNMESFKSYGVVYGIDISSQALKYCKKRRLKNIFLSSAEKTPFDNNFFDVITLLDVLEHTDDMKVLKEMNRILKPGGIIVISVPAYMMLWSKWDEVLHHKRRYTSRSLQLVILRNGFTKKKISYLFSFLIFPVMIVRFIKSKKNASSYKSDFSLNSSYINKIMYVISYIESMIIQVVNIPFGTSIICIAKKNEN